MRRIDGELVADAAMALRVEVTKRDIEQGAPLNQNACAIAVACRRQLKGVTDAYVHLGRLFLCINGHWKRWYVPRYARDEIVAFDRGGKFVPQEIIFTPPPPTRLVRMVNRIRGNPAPQRSKPKRKRVVHRTPEVREGAWANIPAAAD